MPEKWAAVLGHAVTIEIGAPLSSTKTYWPGAATEGAFGQSMLPTVFSGRKAFLIGI
jgi:hypothetical protein